MPAKPARLSMADAIKPVGVAALYQDTRYPGSEKLEGARLVSLNHIDPNPRQPRQNADPERFTELVNDVRDHGILLPLILRPLADGRYMIVAGERRYRAAQALNLPSVPAIIRADIDEDRAVEISLVENLQREDLDIEDEARYLKALYRHVGTFDGVAGLIHKSRSYVQRRIRLIEIPGALAHYRAGHLDLNDLLDVPTPRSAPVAPMPVVEASEPDPVPMAELVSAVQPELDSVVINPRSAGTKNEAPMLPRSWSVLTPVNRTIGVFKKLKAEEIPPEEVASVRQGLDELIARAMALREQLGE